MAFLPCFRWAEQNKEGRLSSGPGQPRLANPRMERAQFFDFRRSKSAWSYAQRRVHFAPRVYTPYVYYAAPRLLIRAHAADDGSAVACPLFKNMDSVRATPAHSASSMLAVLAVLVLHQVNDKRERVGTLSTTLDSLRTDHNGLVYAARTRAH